MYWANNQDNFQLHTVWVKKK